jgi:phosphoglycerate-specific signal transduction histidine kinase
VPRTFRAKLMSIVGTAALALIVLIVAGKLVASRVENQLALIQRLYMPKVELGPKLEAEFERITRRLQDAVAAQDVTALNESRLLERRFVEQLDRAGAAIERAEAASLRAAVEDYYLDAESTSRRLIAGETGEDVVNGIASMRWPSIDANSWPPLPRWRARKRKLRAFDSW